MPEKSDGKHRRAAGTVLQWVGLTAAVTAIWMWIPLLGLFTAGAVIAAVGYLLDHEPRSAVSRFFR